MSQLVEQSNSSLESTDEPKGLVLEQAEKMLFEAQEMMASAGAEIVPFASMLSIGGMVAEMVPALRTMTTTTNSSINMQGLLRVTNMEEGDSFKIAKKDKKIWGAIKSPDGSSKMMKLEEVGDVTKTVTEETTLPIDPATIAVGAALVAIEAKLEEISDKVEKVQEFLDDKQDAEVEGMLQSLMDIARNYKNNWDNDRYLDTYATKVADYMESARKNIAFYQKQINRNGEEGSFLTKLKTVSMQQAQLLKSFKYYQMSIYTYAFSSFLEAMLTQNTSQGNLMEKTKTLETLALDYRTAYTGVYETLEGNAKKAIGTLAKKGIGKASGAVGELIGSIPGIKEGQVDEWLISRGSMLEVASDKDTEDLMEQFASIKDPGCYTFISSFRQMDKILNKTKEVYIDHENIYLLS